MICWLFFTTPDLLIQFSASIVTVRSFFMNWKFVPLTLASEQFPEFSATLCTVNNFINRYSFFSCESDGLFPRKLGVFALFETASRKSFLAWLFKLHHPRFCLHWRLTTPPVRHTPAPASEHALRETTPPPPPCRYIYLSPTHPHPPPRPFLCHIFNGIPLS